VQAINHQWNHFRPISTSGGVWSVNNPRELMIAVKQYLRTPELHRHEREWIVKHVCQTVDGQAGQRMAAAVAEVLATTQPAQAVGGSAKPALREA
jgi:hypothetical protein